MPLWNIVDVGSIWMKEFASALAKIDPIQAWSPRFRNFGMFQDRVSTVAVEHPPLTTYHFPLQRGYARAPVRWLVPYERSLLRHLLDRTPHPADSPLICSTPFYAPLAELWPGPVVYYVTDLTVAYDHIDPAQVRALDKRMVRIAVSVCPNSRRIANYLSEEAGCDRAKITIVPNATRASNIAACPQFEPGQLPDDVLDLPRPIVGVLGDLSGNMDWELTAEAVRGTSDLSWLFVGPTDRVIANRRQAEARAWVMSKARFVGRKPYGELQRYARCVDVAVLPYRKHEPTYSGSSTRFYEHLAAGRPMVATRGFAELLEKEPLLKLVDTADELTLALRDLERVNFSDGFETERWQASKAGTWEERARALRATLLQDAAAASPLDESLEAQRVVELT